MWEMVTSTIQVVNSLSSTNVKLVRFLNNNIGAAHIMAKTSQPPPPNQQIIHIRRFSKLKAMKGHWKNITTFHFIKQHFFITSKGVPIIDGRDMA